MPSAAHRREWESFRNDDPSEDEDVGSVQPRARFTAPALVGAAEVKPDRRRIWGVGLVVLGLLALLLLPSTQELLVRLRGAGYVHWHSVRWQAVQAAVTHGKPLVVLTKHASQGAEKATFSERVLAHEALQRLAERCIWVVDDTGPIGVEPTISVLYLDDATELAGPWKLSEITPPQLERDLKAALEEAQELNDATLKGS